MNDYLIQIVIVIIFVAVLYGWFLPYVYNDVKDTVIHQQDEKLTTEIISGTVNLNRNSIEFDIYNKEKYPFYRKLHKSANIDGGTQYSVSFWLNKHSLNLGNDNKQLDLLLIGNKTPVIANKFIRIKDKIHDMTVDGSNPHQLYNTEAEAMLKLYENENKNKNNIFKFQNNGDAEDYYKLDGINEYRLFRNYANVYNTGQNIYDAKNKIYFINKPEIIQKSPYIYFRYFSKEEITFETKNNSTGISNFTQEGIYLVIEFNTIKRFNNKIFIPENGKILSHFNLSSWALFTFVFKTNKNYLPFQSSFDSGCTISLYINDTLMLEKTIDDDSIVANAGNIYVLPKFDSLKQSNQDYLKNTGKIADIMYYNYALTQPEITSLHNKGYNNTLFTEPRDLQKQKLNYQYYKLSLTDKTEKDYSYA